MANAKQRRKALKKAERDQTATKKDNSMKASGGGGKYAQKVAQRKIGQRPDFEARDEGIRPDVDARADWEIARDEGKSSRGPAKPKPASRPVKEDVLQTMFFRGPAGKETELNMGGGHKVVMLPSNNINSDKAATSILAVNKGEEPIPCGEEGRTQPVWEIKRLVGFKAANEGLRSAENVATVQTPRHQIESALQEWVKRYGHTEVASNMASPMAGAEVVQKPWGGVGRHLRR